MEHQKKDNSAGTADCFQCKYFAVTWEPKTPRLCRYFGFKSAGLPMYTVYESSGAFCTAFVKK